MSSEVSIVKCESYDYSEVKASLFQALSSINGLDFVYPGIKVVIKANLVSFINPKKAATTHPVLISALAEILSDMGAFVTVGDSPGGLYNSTYVNRVYKTTGMDKVDRIQLNQNFAQRTCNFDDAKIAKSFSYTSYLDDFDAIINFSKLKTHGMMGMSNSVKNMFGIIPGTIKPEYHFKYPNHDDFANMLIDLNEKFKPALCISDAITAMEGNGPTAGTPRHMGLIAASKDPYKLDLVCAYLIGLSPKDVPTLNQAYKRNLAPANIADVNTDNSPSKFIVEDFQLVPRQSITFEGNNDFFGKLLSNILRKTMQSYPSLTKSKCVGCSECYKICPAKAIVMKNSAPAISRKKCIYCFCCQEFCPYGALKVKRPTIAKLLDR